MADDVFALSPIAARPVMPGDADYDAIRDAFMETSRGRWFLAEYAKRNRNATVIVATSGDTGSAAIAALRGQPNVDVVVLHPHGRTSDVQRRQMTSVLDSNIHNIALEGTFDDSQNIVKALFADREFADRTNLTAVNSINFARILAQCVYYFTAAASLGAGAGVYVMGYRIAMLVSGALALILADHLEWRQVYWLMAGVMAIGSLVVVFAREPAVPGRQAVERLPGEGARQHRAAHRAAGMVELHLQHGGADPGGGARALRAEPAFVVALVAQGDHRALRDLPSRAVDLDDHDLVLRGLGAAEMKLPVEHGAREGAQPGEDPLAQEIVAEVSFGALLEDPEARREEQDHWNLK